MKNQKVFCIGFHKTGTTSMRDALNILGYKVAGAWKQREFFYSKESKKISCFGKRFSS